MSDAWPFLGSSRSLEIVGAHGAYLETGDGRTILDAAGGAIVANIGYGRREVVDAISAATLRTPYVVPPWLTPERKALVQTLTRDWLPYALSRVHLTCGGSEAVETALKIAYQYFAARGLQKKHKVIGRTVSYHGTTLTTTAIGGHEARKRGLEHVLARFPRVETPYPLRCPSSDPASYYVEALEHTIRDEHPDTVAAVLAEPIIGASGGAIVPPDGYWERVRELCTQNDILLIMDEVMTGFGRTGEAFGYQHWPIEPDILIGGKGLGGGYAPIVGVFAGDEIAAAIGAAGYSVMFHTFGAHAGACAAAVAVLEILARENLVQRSKDIGHVLKTRLKDAFANHAHVAEVRGEGLLLAIEVVKDRDSLALFPEDANVSGRIVGRALERGVFFYGGGNGVVRDIVCLGPAFTIEQTEIDLMVDTLVEAVNAVTE